MARTLEPGSIENLFSDILAPSKDENYDPKQILCLRTYPEYISRIETFNAILWHSKPACLSPPIVALYGWQLYDSNVLKCSQIDCEEVLNCELPERTNSCYPIRLEKILRSLIQCHNSCCKFSRSTEPIDFLTNYRSTFLFHNRMATFKNVENLPSIESKFLSRHGDKLEELYQFHNSDGNISRNGFLFSLTGWKYCHETESLICEADARSVPIGRFIDRKFNSDREHRPWSIWLTNYCIADLSLVHNGLSAIASICIEDINPNDSSTDNDTSESSENRGTDRLILALVQKMNESKKLKRPFIQNPISGESGERSYQSDSSMDDSSMEQNMKEPNRSRRAIQSVKEVYNLLDSCISPKLKKTTT